MRLHELLAQSAARAPRSPAVEGGADVLTYAELRGEAEALAGCLRRHGVRPSDRVGIALAKSPDSVATLLGVLGAGAACVPVEASAPPDRNAAILADGGARAIVTDRAGAATLRETLHGAHGAAFEPVDELPGGRVVLRARAEPALGPPGLAYLLYTSGSTGRPKGVAISHRAAESFVRWCAATFDVGPADRFSSHAPFHFDLSILDVYLALGCGGTLVLVDEETARQPRRLAPFIAERRLSVWYSTPSVLSLLVQHGHLERHDASALRYVLFAGEVFAVRHLRALTAAWPTARYFNLYGPTETNVCTFHEVALPVPPGRTEPYPIGRPCSHVETAVLDEQGQPVARGAPGELCVRGEPVMDGYWNLPERTAAAFHPSRDGAPWYRTGDVVVESDDGYVYVGRRDRMVKRRGHRVELGEIEARLYRHPLAAEVAVVALPDGDHGVHVRAFVRWRDGQRPSLVQLKAFCARELPAAMVPDSFVHAESIPKTSTDKIDYQRLARMA